MVRKILFSFVLVLMLSLTLTACETNDGENWYLELGDGCC